MSSKALATTAIQTPRWLEYVDPLVNKLVGHYIGSREEQMAQAIVDLLSKQVDKYQNSSQLIGGFLLYARARRLYKHLGYGSMDEFISAEKVGGLGRTQAYKLMKVAQHTLPPNQLSAPQLGAPTINAGTTQLLMTPDFVTRIGTERAYALAQTWDKSTPERRQELMDAADSVDNKTFYDTAYGNEDRISFDVQGDEVLLWQDSVGTRVALLVTLDPALRSILLDRLNTIPRARL